jgi:hypothetical protein
MASTLLKTGQPELVETHNLVLCLRRLKAIPGVEGKIRWRRALYHALLMAWVGNPDELRKIREGLGLP